MAFQRPVIVSRPHNEHKYGEISFWVKGVEADRARNEKLTVVIRPGDRTDESKTPEQFMPVGVPVPIFFIKVPGDQAKGIAAQFYDDDGTTVVIEKQKVVKLGEITCGDLHFGKVGAVVYEPIHVQDYLEAELAPGRKFDKNSVLTLSYIWYLPKAF